MPARPSPADDLDVFTCVLSDGSGKTATRIIKAFVCGVQCVDVLSDTLNYGPTGWGGWSCLPSTKIFSATVINGPANVPAGQQVFVVPASANGLQVADLDNEIKSTTLWKVGASVSGFNYPFTPFGYTYQTGEEGAIVQNGLTPQHLRILLTCKQA
jgi:hypothetical protein